MTKEKLICDCKDEDGNAVDTNHVQYVDQNKDVVVECDECGRFIKLKELQKGIKKIGDEELKQK